jgi:hypothetical protein
VKIYREKRIAERKVLLGPVKLEEGARREETGYHISVGHELLKIKCTILITPFDQKLKTILRSR